MPPQPHASTTKIAILGGGMGALSAAWHLTEVRDPNRPLEITVYQRGWRLGGKGASGRALTTERRIEEHGLHILMGFYDEALGMLRSCYDELHENPSSWPGGALLPWADALTRQEAIWVAEQWAGDWNFWCVPFSGLTPLARDRSVLDKFFADIGAWIDDFQSGLHELTGEEAPAGPFATWQVSIAKVREMKHEQRLRLADRLVEMMRREWASVQAHLSGSVRARQLFVGLYLASTNVVGMLRDRLVASTETFSRIDGEDYRAWLRRHGPFFRQDLSWDSPPVRAVYDLAFSLQRTLAAGVTLLNLMRILFGWREAVYFKMNAGMGDVVFAPLYLALRARGVRFRFFHRATKLGVDPATRLVSSIELEPQVRAPVDYDPLIPVPEKGKRFPCWPSEAKAELLDDRYRVQRQKLGRPPHDFETDVRSPFALPPVVLRRDGGDFHHVVLGVSVGGLRGDLCRELRRANPRFARMLDEGARTMPTQAVQLWLKRPPSGANGMGWKEGRAMAGYEGPFTATTDMNQVLPAEPWPNPEPRTCAYLCGAFPDAPADKASATRDARRNADRWLDDSAYRLWPGVAAPGKFDRNELVHPDRGCYPRANVDPSDQYVLSEKGTIQHRLAPGESGFGNLFLAGDWVRNELSSGCLESACLGGLGAGRALLAGGAMSGLPAYVELDGDWVMPPPGLLEQVSMRVFVFRADPDALRAVCQAMLGDPSDDEVTAEPLLGLVVVACADIQRGSSESEPDRGYSTEKDVAFFVPVRLRHKGASLGVSFLIPYIYVDNMAGMIMGREIYGFTKLLGDIDFSRAGTAYEARSLAREDAGPNEKIEDKLIVRIEAPPTASAAVIAGDASTMLRRCVERVYAELELPAPISAPSLDVPQVFLKQFRDAAEPGRACYQAIVRVASRITRLRSATVTGGPIQASLPAYDSLEIARTLGLGEPLQLSFAADLDFRIPYGSILWQKR